MFNVKIVARPDARMVEVPLEFECELPREFDGQAVLASSGVPRKVRLKLPKDAVKISTAYRADVLLADIVRLALRGSVADMQKVQEAAQRFVRLVRERRQDGASLTVSSNGRGLIEVLESGLGPAAARPPPQPPQPPAKVPLVARPALGTTGLRQPPLATPITPAPAGHTRPDGGLLEKLTTLERRISQLESAVPRLLEERNDAPLLARIQALEEQVKAGSARTADLDEKLEGVHGELRAAEAESATRIGLLQQRLDHGLPNLWQDVGPGESRRGSPRKSTAVDAFAQGLRVELRARVSGILSASAGALDRLDRAAALAAEGALSLGVPAPLADDVRESAAQAAARHQALLRLDEELDFYEAPDLPVAALLVDRLERQTVIEAAGLLRLAVSAAGAGKVDDGHLAGWIARAAALCGDALVEVAPGDPIDPREHELSPLSEPRGAVARMLAPGVKKPDGTAVRRPRVESNERAAEQPRPPSDPAAGSPAGEAGTPTAPPLALPATPDAAPLPAPEARGSAPQPTVVDDGRVIPALPMEAPAAAAAAPPLAAVEPAEPAEPVVELAPEDEVVEPSGENIGGDSMPPPPQSAASPPADASRLAPGGDLWGEVNSDSAWASITVSHDAPEEDPWGTSPEKKPEVPPAANDGSSRSDA